MKTFRLCVLCAVVVPLSAVAQSGRDSNQTPEPESAHSAGPVRDIGGGTGTIGLGAAKGAGHIGEGAAKGAADVITLHPIKGTTNVVKGTAEGGKDVTVGTAKGTGKVFKGIGKTFKKIF
jgi:hypothetical protein